MEEIPNVQKAFMLLDLLRMDNGLLTSQEYSKIKEELLTLLNIK